MICLNCLSEFEHSKIREGNLPSLGIPGYFYITVRIFSQDGRGNCLKFPEEKQNMNMEERAIRKFADLIPEGIKARFEIIPKSDRNIQNGKVRNVRELLKEL